jgi:hypothetical protein
MENQRTRSPRYPSISLREAVDLARKIYAKDGMHPLDRESAVQHLGYSSLNGASATALASLKQYGLSADAGTGMLRLTDLSLDIIEPTGDEAQHAALQAAAYTPDLFAALRERFPDKPPSESNLRAHLVRQGFTPAAVKSIIPSYLETHEYLATFEVTDSGTPSSTSENLNSPAQQPESQNLQVNPFATGPVPPGFRPYDLMTPNVGTRRMVFDTEQGEAIFTYPDKLSDASIDDLEDWFALVVKRLRRTSGQ